MYKNSWIELQEILSQLSRRIRDSLTTQRQLDLWSTYQRLQHEAQLMRTCAGLDIFLEELKTKPFPQDTSEGDDDGVASKVSITSH